MAEENSDLKLAFEVLKAKQEPFTRLWRYYDGDHPLIYSTERLKEVFQSLNARFVQNWCAVVVDSVLDRVLLKRFVVSGDAEATDRLNRLWMETEMALDDDDAHMAALVCGESFVVVWKDDEGKVEAYYHDPRLCHLFYDAEHPRRKRLAVKWWVGEDKRRYLNLYYPERIEYYVSSKPADQVDSHKGFKAAADAAANPFGVVPVFHLRRERRRVKSELEGVLTLQDAVNKLLADMMVAAEFGAFRQRYVISNVDVEGELKNAPNEIWDLPAGDGIGQATQVGEFSATELRNYLDAIDEMATAIAVITRTPKHYFFDKAGSNPSGEALIAMEAPLDKKAARYTERFTVAWRKIGAFMLLLDGREVDEGAIKPVFDDPRTLQPFTQAQARQLNVAAGIPIRTQLRWEGKSEEEIAQMEADREAERAANQAGLANALLDAQRRFDQGEEA